jgi:predicted dehydrogenase
MVSEYKGEEEPITATLLEVAVEKPFTTEANRAIAAAAKKSGKILTVFQRQSNFPLIF